MAKRTSSTLTKRVYVGPKYRTGIRLPGAGKDIRPADWTPTEVEAFLADHPKYAQWWESPAAPEPEPEPAPAEA